ncbi:iron-containing redox enzyme family protein [soil metagenome]
MRLPVPRGALSRTLFNRLAEVPTSDDLATPEASGPGDEAISLWVLHELHYRGFDDVDDRWEWSPALARTRSGLEEALEARLRARYTPPVRTEDVAGDLFAMIAAHDGPSIAEHVQRRATRAEVLQLMRERSIYHLTEADPTSWVIPRLEAAPKAALMEIQFDEYGAGRPERLHHQLFAVGLEQMGLSAEYGAYIDEVPLEVLEQNNALSLLGLHRRLRAAALGHLAAVEATSSVPSKRMKQGLERLGFSGGLVDYYAEHVLADAVHDQIAVRAVCVPLAAESAVLADDVFFGAFTCLDLEARTARSMLERWVVAA